MMRVRACLLLVVIVAARGDALTGQQSGFDAWFLDKTMRVDYVHSGGLGQEIFALDQVVSDGPWAGSRTRLLDDLNLGKYRFEVIRPADQRGPVLPWLRIHLRRVGDDARVPRGAPQLPRIAAVSVAEGPGPGRARGPERGQQLPGALVHRHRPCLPVRQPRGSRARRRGVAPLRERPARREGRSARDRRGVHGGGDSQVPCRRDPPRERPVRGGAFSAAGRATSTCGASTCRRPSPG